MLHNQSGRAASAASDRDAPPTTEGLPPRYNRRWSAQQQRQVLGAIDDGSLTAAEAILRYALGANDLTQWRKALAVLPVDIVPHATVVGAGRPADRVSRLIDVLLKRGLIDAFDAASVGLPHGSELRGESSRDDGLAALFAQFIVDDAPII